MKTVLTNNEKSVLVAIVANAKKVGDSGVEFILADVAEAMGKNIRSITATAGSLAKKGMLLTANGESYFDGRVTDEGLHEVEATVQADNNNGEEEEFDAPAMDSRIVKLNEFRSVKMASVTKSKRAVARAIKTAAQYVLERWDDAEELQRLVDDEEMKVMAYEVWAIADSRIKQLTVLAAKEANYQKALDKYREVRNEIDDTRRKNKDKREVVCIVKVGDVYVVGDKDAETLGEVTGVKVEGVNGVKMVVFGEKDFDNYLRQLIAKGNRVAVVDDINKPIRTLPDENKPTNKNEAASKPQTASSDKDTVKRGRKPSTERKVGDRHPNGRWIWTEYAPGKFDWRADPAQKHQGKSATAAEPKKTAKTAPQPKRKNIDEWAAMTTRLSHLRRNLSKAQKDALQYIYKGYRITADRKFWRNDKGDNKACVWGALEALLRRYNTDYVPQGLIIE